MEYTLENFTNLLIELMKTQFPYMLNEDLDRSKHPKREPLHLKSAVFDKIQVARQFNQNIFDIGNDSLEKTHPYYHILQEAQVIRKRNKGTTKSKGSQAQIQDVGKRDYTRIEIAKTNKGVKYKQEYKKNVRGARSLIGSSSHWTTSASGEKIFVNREANYYENIHYHYLDNMLNNGIVDMLAETFGLKRKGTQFTGLADEYQMQTNIDEGVDDPTNLINIMNSFE